MTGGEDAEVTKERVAHHLVFGQSHDLAGRDRHAVQAKALWVDTELAESRVLLAEADSTCAPSSDPRPPRVSIQTARRPSARRRACRRGAATRRSHLRGRRRPSRPNQRRASARSHLDFARVRRHRGFLSDSRVLRGGHRAYVAVCEQRPDVPRECDLVIHLFLLSGYERYMNLPMKSSAVWATSRQPWSMVSAWPRLGTLTISVTAGLRLCRL
jgi:hypothetical protein